MRSDTNAIMNEISNNVVSMTQFGKEITEKGARLGMDLSSIIVKINNLEVNLRDCVNELCLKCGDYRNEHLGACNDCRWKEVRRDHK